MKKSSYLVQGCYTNAFDLEKKLKMSCNSLQIHDDTISN